MNGTTKYIGYALIISVLAVFLRVAWVVFYPYEPIIIKSIEISDPDNTVVAGEELQYITNYEKKMDLQASVSRRLVNSYVLSVPTYTRSVPVGKGRSRNSITIPSFADPGTYRLNIVYTYKVSSWPERYVNVDATSGPFTVINATKQVIQATAEKVKVNTEDIKKNAKKMAIIGERGR
jgi:hypothetical protein